MEETKWYEDIDIEVLKRRVETIGEELNDQEQEKFALQQLINYLERIK